MSDLKRDLLLDHDRHVPVRFIHILHCPIEEIKIDNHAWVWQKRIVKAEATVVAKRNVLKSQLSLIIVAFSDSLGKLMSKTSCSNGDLVLFPPFTRRQFYFGSCAEASSVVTWIESQSVLKSAPKGIGAFESDR